MLFCSLLVASERGQVNTIVCYLLISTTLVHTQSFLCYG